MAGRKKGSGNAKPSDIQAGLDALIRLGSSEAAARATGFEAATIRRWKSSHPDKYHDLAQNYARELESEHAGNVREAWRDLNEARRLAIAQIRTGCLEARDFRAYAQTIADFAKFGDTVARLNAGDPTSIREDRRTDAELLAALELAADRAGVVLELPEIDPAVVTHTGRERH